MTIYLLIYSFPMETYTVSSGCNTLRHPQQKKNNKYNQKMNKCTHILMVAAMECPDAPLTDLSVHVSVQQNFFCSLFIGLSRHLCTKRTME